MEKEFYYLDEKEQKGPFNIDQLKKVSLKPDTLVWADGFENWKPVKNVEELKFFLRKTPPPPPIIDNLQSSINEFGNESQYTNKIFVEDSNVKFWVSFKIYTTVFLLIATASLFAYLFSNSKKQNLKKEIYSKIENILNGKTVVLDGNESITQGKLEQTGYNSKSHSKSDEQFGDSYKPWWEREKLYTIYKASNGGFTIKQLTKQNEDGYDIETYSSGDMGYKKSSGRYVKPEYMDMGYGERMKVGGGFYSSNYRLSIRQCYTQAFEYFTKEDKKSPGAFTPGKYIDISNFSDIRNDYFFMDNTAPKKYSTSGISASSWHSADEHSNGVGNEDNVVYYSMYGKHYEIAENETAINKDLLSYLGVSIGAIILLLLIGLFSKPNYFRNLNLFGKRWKNNSYQEQIFFFEHSFFGKHTFMEIINDEVFKGVIKFIDKGNTINLSYPSKELFYKIEEIDQDNLILVSIKDKSKITFKRIGAKEIEDLKIKETTKQTAETNQNF